MQRNHLEQFIQDNREAFDTDLPELRVWGNISQQLDRRKRRRLLLWRAAGMAAAVVGLLFCGVALGGYLNAPPIGAVAVMEQLDGQYLQKEAAYQEAIQEKYQQLASYEQAGAVQQDLQRLDEAIRELREELATAPPGKAEDIVEQLLENYQTKVYILERVLDRIQMANPEWQPSTPPKAEPDDRII